MIFTEKAPGKPPRLSLSAGDGSWVMETKYKILIVDDSEMNRELLMAILGDRYEFIQAENGRQAIFTLQKDLTVDLLLLDINMPEMDGFQVLERMKQLHWTDEIPVIMISAEESHPSIERAYALGVTDYIHRPFDAYIVRRRVQNTLSLYANQKRLMNIVTDLVYEKEKNNNLMIDILSNIVEFRNQESSDHVLHIRTATELLLRHLVQKTDVYHLSEEEVARIITASALHDIGKIDIPSSILNKPGRLTPEEFAVIKTHPVIGASILKNVSADWDEPLLHTALEICRWHHERWDGHGYPDGLLGEQIPISAQIVGLADVYDALTSDRCYKKAYDHGTAMFMIMNGECGAFSPLLLECLREIGPKLQAAFRHTGKDPSYYREAGLLSTELLKSNAIPVSDRAQRLLESLQTRIDFFASCNGGLQFEYDHLSKMVTVTNWDEPPQYRYSLVNMEDPEHSQLFRQLNREDFLHLRDALHATTVNNPEFSLNVRMTYAGETHWCNLRVRTLWSPLVTEHYAGAVGQLTDPQRHGAIRKTGASRSETQSSLSTSSLSVSIHHLQEIFDIVRLVDPQTRSVLEMDADGALRSTGQFCAAFWESSGICSNCIAAKALSQRSTLNKLEFTSTDAYFVIAKYLCINGTPCVLELLSKMDSGRWVDANGTRLLLDRSRGENRALFTDPVTGAYSRRYLETYLMHLEGMEGVAIIDVDNFKAVNDTYGHAAGDAALRDIATAVLSNIRNTDILIRYGGDEFLLLYPQISADFLPVKNKQLQDAVNRIILPEYPGLHLSISVGGVCGVHPISEAIREADSRMYQNKASKPDAEGEPPAPQ